MERIEWMRGLIVPLIILVSFAASNPERAFACSCVVNPNESPEEAVKDALAKSTAVFAGKVVDLKVPVPTGSVISTADPVTITFQVSEVWKGPAYRRLVIHTARSEVSCGYEFQMGQEYLVYAYGLETKLETNLCWRNQLHPAKEDLAVLGQGSAPTIENPDIIPNAKTSDSSKPMPPYLLSTLTLAAVLGVMMIIVVVIGRRAIGRG